MAKSQVKQARSGHPSQPADQHNTDHQELPASPSAPDRLQVVHLGSGYLVALVLAEILTTFAQGHALYLGPVLFAATLLLLLLHTALYWDRPIRYLPLVLAFAPAGRLVLLLLGPAGPSPLYGPLAIALPTVAAAVATLYILRRSSLSDRPRSLGEGTAGKRVAAALLRGAGRARSWFTATRAGLLRGAGRARSWLAATYAGLLRGAGRARSWLAATYAGLRQSLRRTFARLGAVARRWPLPRLRETALFQSCRRGAVRLQAGLSRWYGQVLRPRLRTLWEKSLPLRQRVRPWAEPALTLCRRARSLWMRLPPLSSPPIRLRAIPLLLTALTSLLIIQLDGGTPPWGMEGYGGGSTSWNLGNAARGTLSRYARPRGIGAAANNRTQPAGKRSDRIRIGTGVGLAASPEHVDEIRKLVQALSQDSPDSTAGLIVFRAEPTDSESTASLSSPGLPAGCPIQSYGNPYPLGVCTWYAKEKRPDLPSFSFPYALALNWPEAAELCGFRVDRQPAPGAVIVYPPGANGAWSGGHVGYVEEVGADYLLTSECNINHSSGWAVAPLWWEAGYECGFKHIPFAQLDPRVIYIHRRVAPPAPPSPEDTATTRTTEPPSLQPRFQ